MEYLRSWIWASEGYLRAIWGLVLDGHIWVNSRVILVNSRPYS